MRGVPWSVFTPSPIVNSVCVGGLWEWRGEQIMQLFEDSSSFGKLESMGCHFPSHL